jgi:hypothetical protein
MCDKTVAAVHDWLAAGCGALVTWLGDGLGLAAVDAGPAAAGVGAEGAAHPAQAAASARTPAAGILATRRQVPAYRWFRPASTAPG